MSHSCASAADPVRIAFVTVCKGRLHHIRQTLPRLVEQVPDEIVVVDYDCPQGVGAWVQAHHPSVRVVHVHDEQGFCLSRGRNEGARSTTAPWICFIDADVLIEPGWVDWMRSNLRGTTFYRQSRSGGQGDSGCYGTVICPRSGFETVQGYDEIFRGWGGEDDDLYDRLRWSGHAEDAYPAEFVRSIPHDDSERVAFHAVKSKVDQHVINRFYRSAKMPLMAFYRTRGELPLALRRQIQERVRAALVSWDGAPGTPLPRVSFSVAVEEGLTSSHRLVKRFNLALEISEVVR